MEGDGLRLVDLPKPCRACNKVPADGHYEDTGICHDCFERGHERFRQEVITAIHDGIVDGCDMEKIGKVFALAKAGIAVAPRTMLKGRGPTRWLTEQDLPPRRRPRRPLPPLEPLFFPPKVEPQKPSKSMLDRAPLLPEHLHLKPDAFDPKQVRWLQGEAPPARPETMALCCGNRHLASIWRRPVGTADGLGHPGCEAAGSLFDPIKGRWSDPAPSCATTRQGVGPCTL